MWDARYSEAGFAYGTRPNDFLASAAGALSDPVICLACGEGRNPVWLAERGLEVHAVDGSAVGVRKTLELAAARGVTVHARQADLADFDLGEGRWGGVVTIFAHTPPLVRARMHAGIVRGLRPGGVLVAEAYTPRQLSHRTGGPPEIEMLYDPATVRAELVGLDFERFEALERPVVEGKYHTGTAAVLQVIGRRPAG